MRATERRTSCYGNSAGCELTSSLVRDIDIEGRQRQQLRNIIANVEVITSTLRADLP